MRKHTSHALAALAVFAVFASSAFALDATDPVATVAGEPITLSDLEASVQSQLDQFAKQRHLLLESAIRPLVERRLVEREAAAREITPAELVTAEVESKITAVTEEEIQAWYNENQARLRGAELEKVSDQIKSFLEQERGQVKYAALIKDLRAKYETVVHFEPLRLEVDMANATWKGKEEAPVTLVEFSDFQCPACKGFNPTVTQLLAQYPDQVKVAFLQNPLRAIHPEAQGAAEAALCARDAGKFWEMHDVLFDQQRNLGLEAIKVAADEMGLDESFDACLDSNKYADTVQADVDQAMALGVTGTPSIFINGRQVAPGKVPSLQALVGVVEDELSRLETGE